MQLLRKMERARRMLAKGEYAALLDRISDGVMPVGNPVLYWDRFVIVELRQPRRAPGPSLGVHTASTEELERLCALHPAEADRFRKRIEGGQRCLVACDGDQIAARAWLIGDHPAHVSNSGYVFLPRHRPSAWCHDIFVEPAYRRRGYFGALIDAARAADGPQGPSLYAEIHFLNHASIRAHQNYGYEIIRDVVVLSTLGLKTYVVTDQQGRRSLDYRYARRLEHN